MEHLVAAARPTRLGLDGAHIQGRQRDHALAAIPRIGGARRVQLRGASRNTREFKSHEFSMLPLMRTTVRYWEGLMRVSNMSGEYLGDGYLEMTR